MRVTQISPYTAYPPQTGGEHRIHGLMSGKPGSDNVVRFAKGALSQKYSRDGDIVEINENYQEYRYRHFLESLCSTAIKSTEDVANVFTNEVLSVTRPQKLNELLEDSDVVLVEHPWQFPYVSAHTPSDTPVVYSSHNFELSMYRDLIDSWMRPLILKQVARLERLAVIESDLVISTTERDARLMQDQWNTDTPFHVAPNGTTVKSNNIECSTAPDFDGDLKAIFIGNEHQPNVRAVEQICRIAPTVKNVDFLIVGTVCNSLTDTPPNVHLLGFVEDLEEVYAMADVGLNPIVSGGGSNVKMVEYLSYGLPVITTAFGARGLPVEDGIHCFIRDIEMFQSAVNEILEGELPVVQVSENAQEIVEEQLNWEAISNDVFTRLHKLVESTSSKTSSASR